ncbi:hypothetical protein D3C78_846810 [compost metagenome]
MITYTASPLVYLSVNIRLIRIRIAHHVTIHIAAGCKRAEHGIINFLDRIFQVPFDNTMQLEGLTRCKTYRSIRIFLCNTIHHQPLLRSNDPSGSTYAQHELISWLKLLLIALIAQITVILHIAAVEFHETVIVFRDRASNAILEGFC